jgi:fused signal recognition particle receptor
MFKFLKDKLKKAVSIFSKKVEKEAEIKEEIKETVKEEIKEGVKEIKIEEKEAGEKPEVKETEEVRAEEIPEAPEPEEILEEPVEEEAGKEIKEEMPEEETKEEIKEEIKPEEEEITKKIKEAIGEELEEKPEKIEEKIEEKPEEELKLTKEEIEEQVKGLKGELEKEFEEAKPEAAVEKEEKPQKASFLKKLFGKKEKREEKPAEVKKELEWGKKPEEPEIKLGIKPEIRKELDEQIEEEPEKEKGFFKRIKETFTTVKLSDEKFEKLFWELEVVLLENNVAVEVIDKIKSDLRVELTTGKVSRKRIEELVEDSLRESIRGLFINYKSFNLVNEIRIKKKKPYIIVFIGVNGSGKTTNMAKLAHLLMKNNLSVVFAASDTFRAAAIQQLQEHADKLGVKMIRHDYESDPAAVAFDAIEHAKAKGIDVVLIDTAGRLHVNDNLMNELKKLVRVNKPDLKIFVGESITGNDCVEQAKIFDEIVGIDAIILAKADVDEKGGAAVSVSYVTKKPIIYLGTGQKYEDLEEFKPEIIIKSIGL